MNKIRRREKTCLEKKIKSTNNKRKQRENKPGQKKEIKNTLKIIILGPLTKYNQGNNSVNRENDRCLNAPNKKIEKN